MNDTAAAATLPIDPAALAAFNVRLNRHNAARRGWATRQANEAARKATLKSATIDLGITATRLNRQDAAKRGVVTRQAKAAARKADALVAELLLQAEAQAALEVLASEQHTPTVTPASKATYCICCNAPTRGGKFLPGHDARYASVLLQQFRSGEVDQRATLFAASTISDAFHTKVARNLAKVHKVTA